MKCTTMLLLAGLSAGFAAQAAEPAATETPQTGTYAGVTVAIDPATGRLRAPTAAEQAELRAAMSTRRTIASPMSTARPGPRTVAEAQRTLRRHPNGMMSMQVPEEMMSQVVATQLEDGSIVIGHGDADSHGTAVNTVEAARE